MNVTVAVYQRKDGPWVEWTTLGLGELTETRRGAHSGKVQEALVDVLRVKLAKLRPNELSKLQFVRGIRFEMPKLELDLKGDGRKRKVAMFCPLVLEPRWITETERLTVGYHPARQQDWFPVRDGDSVIEQATAFLQHAWAELDDFEIDALRGTGRGSIKAFQFTLAPRSLLDDLPRRPTGVWDDLRAERPEDEEKRRRGGVKMLPKIGANVTLQAVEGSFTGGTPRSPAREQLRMLLGGGSKQPTVLVGPSGAGKSTVIERLVLDLLVADDHGAHKNLDRVTQVWRVSGKRIIAGMSYLGEWEKRCLDVLEDTRGRRIILWVEDLHLFGRIGRSRDSDRNLAEFFSAPMSRAEVVMLGECTTEQLRQLEEDAPSFAGMFTRVHVPATDTAETFRLMVREMRVLEASHRVLLQPEALRVVLELGASLFPTRAFPGVGIDLLRRAAREYGTVEGTESARGRAPWSLDRSLLPPPETVVGVDEVLEILHERTGLPYELLRAETPLPWSQVVTELSRSVMGQTEGVGAAADLVVRIRTAMVDPRRPYGVYLFTGPTGTGKTELARALATYLYGSDKRLVRFDMGEFATPDAASRLIGDRWTPEGLLTRAAQEQPFCVILFDEIEKAHPQVHNLLLQLFDEGRLTDASGSLASFAHTVVVMTSNLGARARASVGFGENAIASGHDHLRAVRDFFAPELFNRIDRVVSFAPLSPEVALEVAGKELTKLLSRRGLVDRNVFVSASHAVLARVVREAFRAADGARSLKRYLEDTLGTMLTQHLVRAERADMQIVRIHETVGGYGMTVSPLREADGLGVTFALDALSEMPVEALRARVSDTLGQLEALEASPELGQLAEEIAMHLREAMAGRDEHADALFTLESMRTEIQSFRAEVEQLMARIKGQDHEMIEVLSFNREEFAQSHGEGVQTTRLFDRRAFAGEGTAPVRGEILAAMAEAYALRRAVRSVREPQQHAVYLKLSKAGQQDAWRPAGQKGADGARSYLLELADAYARARGECDARCWFTADGEHDGGLPDAAKEPEVEMVVLKMVGLGVRDFFALEQGTHLLHSLMGAPEIVRVEVLAVEPEVDVIAVVERHREARVRFEKALESGATELPANPDALLPVVRRLRFDPPRRQGMSAPLEIEDYVMGVVKQVQARRATDPLMGLWLVRLSREG